MSYRKEFFGKPGTTKPIRKNTHIYISYPFHEEFHGIK